jgi:ferric enterobactin receptor
MKKSPFLFLTLSLLSFNLIFSQKKDSINKELETVEVQVKKPTIVQKIDRTVFNVAGSSILIGNNSWNILRMTPNIEIDADENLKVNGNKTTVFINNRKSVFNGKDLANYLKSLPAGNIIKIEVITNPSGRYESSGPVINIVLKKADHEGTKGSITVSNQQGRKNSSNSDGNITYHNKKFTQSVTYHLGENRFLHKSSNENRINGFSTNSNENLFNDFHIGGTSTTEYEINEKNTIGTILELHTNTPNSVANGENTFYNHEVLSSKNFQKQFIDARNSMFGANLFYKFYDKNKKDRLFEVNLDFNKKRNKSTNELNTYWEDYSLINGNQIINDEKPLNYSLKMDYSQEIDSTAKMEAGGKINFLNIKQPYLWNDFKNDAWVLNTFLTNDFSYSENINSLYANFDKKFGKKFSIRAGIRFENTQIEVEQKNTNEMNHQSYNRWMPNALVQYQFSENHILTSGYNQFFYRPFYAIFNPFQVPQSNGLFFKGNPNLKPSVYHNYNFKYNFYKIFTLTTDYQYYNSDYWDIFKFENGQTIQIPENLVGKVHRYNFSLNSNLNLFKNKLNINLNVNYSYLDNSDFNQKNNIIANNYINTYSISSNLTYSNFLNKNINFNAHVGYRSPSAWGNSITNVHNIFHSFSVIKVFDKIGLDIKMETNNFFRRMEFDLTAYTSLGTFRNIESPDMTNFKISIVKRFGNQKAKGVSKTETDKERLSGGGK